MQIFWVIRAHKAHNITRNDFISIIPDASIKYASIAVVTPACITDKPGSEHLLPLRYNG